MVLKHWLIIFLSFHLSWEFLNWRKQAFKIVPITPNPFHPSITFPSDDAIGIALIAGKALVLPHSTLLALFMRDFLNEFFASQLRCPLGTLAVTRQMGLVTSKILPVFRADGQKDSFYRPGTLHVNSGASMHFGPVKEAIKRLSWSSLLKARGNFFHLSCLDSETLLG